MKITEIKKYPLAYEGRESLFIEVLTDNGFKGLGEVGVAKMGNAVIAAIEHLEQRLIGEDPWESEKLWQIMFRGNFFPPGFGGKITPPTPPIGGEIITLNRSILDVCESWYRLVTV